MGPQAPLDTANELRAARAAELTTAAVREALDKVGATAPKKLTDAGRLRLAHPSLSLRQLGEHASPPMTKSTLAGRLRRLLAYAINA